MKRTILFFMSLILAFVFTSCQNQEMENNHESDVINNSDDLKIESSEDDTNVEYAEDKKDETDISEKESESKDEAAVKDTNIRTGFLYKSGNNYGFLNKNGEVITEAVFSDVQKSFSDNGLLYVCANGRYGFLNENAEMVIERNFMGTRGFGENGTALVKTGFAEYGYINEKGEMLIGPTTYEATYLELYNFDKFGLARVFIDKKCGLIDINGNWVVYPEYENISSFADNGLARVGVWDTDYRGMPKNQQGGYINTNGEVVIPIQYYALDDFKNVYGDLYLTPVQDRYASDTYYINDKGETVTDRIAISAYRGQKINDAYMYIFDEYTKKIGLLECESGEALTDNVYDRVSVQDNNMVIAEAKNNYTIKYTIFNENCELIIDECDNASYDVFLNCCRAVKDGKTYFINAKGEYILTVDKTVDSFSEIGLAVAYEDNKCGYIDKSGNWVIQPKFLKAEQFSKEGYAVVSVETDYVDKYGIIDKNGNWVFDPIYGNKPELYGEIFHIFEVGLLNKNGVDVIPPVYSNFSFECDNNLIVCKNGDLYDVYYKDGRMIGEGYEAVGGLDDRSYGYDSSKYIKVRKNSKIGVIDKNGEVAVQPLYDNVWLMDDARKNY